MVAISRILLFVAGVSAAAINVEQRAADTTPAQIQTDLTYINGNTTTLKNAVNSWSGTVFGAIPIQEDEQNLEKLINSTTTAAQSSSAFSEAQTQSSISYINNTLEPNIEATLNALVAKKSEFASNGLTSTVLSDLRALKSETNSLGSALINHVPADQKSNANAALAKINTDFTNAINSFS